MGKLKLFANNQWLLLQTQELDDLIK